MIADQMCLLSYCLNYQEIENYYEALNDPNTKWVCHHKDEIELNKSRKELIEMGLYYNIAPEKLIFLRFGDHLALHNEHKKRSGWKLSEETRRKMSEAHKGKKGRKHTEEEKKKMSEAIKKSMTPDVRKKIGEKTGREIEVVYNGITTQYKSIREAAKQLNIRIRTIYKIINGQSRKKLFIRYL